MLGRIVLPNRVEVVISSAGGAGTSFLLSYVAQFKRTNSPVDADGLKHSALPPISFNRACKFVYIHGSPQLAAISLFRRRLHHYQSVKLQRRGRGAISPIPREMTLEEYAAQGIDRFHFRRHFFNWYDGYLAARPTMFIRYETLFDNVRPLMEFLELPSDRVASFPTREVRTSTADEIGSKTLEQLNDMYGGFANELAQLNAVEVRQGSGYWSRPGRYFEIPYLNAYAGHGAFEIKGLMLRYAPKVYTKLRSALD